MEKFGKPIKLGGFEVFLREVFTFAGVIRNKNVRVLEPGKKPVTISRGRRHITYGAGPCVAGISLVDGKPTLFHHTPDTFHGHIPAVSDAKTGVIGGGVDNLVASQRVNPVESFFRLPDGDLSLNVTRGRKNKLYVRYIKS